jgi:hypothetical protein
MRFFKRGPVAHEVQAEAGPLALGTHARGRQPDLRHQLPPRELRDPLGVAHVGLCGEWGEAFRLHRVGDRDVPAVALERVVDEASAGHRLDHGAHLLPLARHSSGEGAQGVGVRADGRHLDRLALLVKDVDIQPLA